MSSVLNSDNIQNCFNCEYCFPIPDGYKCGLRNEETSLTNLCKDYDFNDGDYYAGA